MKRVKTPKLGSEVRLTLMDHGLTDGSDVRHSPLLRFNVYGRLIGINKNEYYVAYWDDVDGTVNVNTEIVKVIRGAVIDIKVYK